METTTIKFIQDVATTNEVDSIFLPALAVADILSAYEFLTTSLHSNTGTITFQTATKFTSQSDSNEIWLKVYRTGDVEYGWSQYEPYKTLGGIVTG